MGYLILLTQQNFLILGHIMSEIAELDLKEWPEKFHDFKSVFLGFNRQRVKTKPNVAHIIPRTEINGFLSTIQGYEKLVESHLDQKPENKDLMNSQKLLESLVIELVTQLKEQNFSVK